MRLGLLSALTLLAAAPGLRAQVTLGETVKPGDQARVEVTLEVRGTLKVERGGRPEALPLTAAARHAFDQRVEAADAAGATLAVRHYDEARSQSDNAGERSARELGADRRMVAVRRTDAGTLHFSPDGPLTREELELVAEHFDPLVLPRLLPDAPVAGKQTWKVPADAAQRACQLSGLTAADLTGTVTAVTPQAVTFTIAGTAEGVETGAAVKLTVTAAGTFDVAAGRVTALTWEQSDVRGQGAASPASEVTAKTVLTVKPLAEEPKSLSVEARAKVPADGQTPELMTLLRYADAAGRFAFVYPREWHVLGRTKDHVVLRLLDGGAFVAQATLTVMKPLDPGAAVPVDEFKRLVAAVPGWVPDAVGEDGVIPTDPGRRLYRLTATGKQDGVPVRQTFYHLAGPNGEQVALTVLAGVDTAAKVGTRDVSLINAVEFPPPPAPPAAPARP